MEQIQSEKRDWIPKTELGHEVLKGKYKTVEEILQAGKVIQEPEIVDKLIPDLKQDIIYIGGSQGKGGGKRRTATKRTARIHKSGRRFKLSAMIVVGNENGIVGLGKASSKEHRIALEKALINSKINIIQVKRGCGSWECGCGTAHSIPYEVSAKVGSVKIILKPAPKGVGMVANESEKKILRLAGIRDIWIKTFGNTGARTNLMMAIYDALRKLNSMKGQKEEGMITK